MNIAPDNPNSDLDNLKPSPPSLKLDDKAATLEQELVGIKARFNQEHVVYLYIINLLFILLLSICVPKITVFIAIVGSLVVQMAIGKWLGFPWMHNDLDGWHRLMIETYRKYILRETAKDADETEPTQ
ncbi:MAG: hypothetical protein ABI230_00590 [Aestuariivirga sp.]